MNTRLILSATLLLGLSGCATYDYVGNDAGGYYHGSAEVQRTYPRGYPGDYGYGSYGYGSYGYGGYGGYYRYYGYPHYLVTRPPHDGHRPPGHGNGHAPPRPGGSQPAHPPPPAGSNKSPWRNMDQPRQPQAGPAQRNAPARRLAPVRPAAPTRAVPERRSSQTRGGRNVHRVKR